MTAVDYKNGGEGFIQWMEDFVCLPIIPFHSTVIEYCPVSKLPDDLHPETGKSYKSMWEKQKDIIRQALRMEDGRFVHKLLIFCWQRGEGKSIVVVCIEAWRFFNFPHQLIMFAANSKDQVQFVHYDKMVEIVTHSPKLLEIIGRKNLREKNIIFRDIKGDIQSELKTISSFSGIVSNINSFTFSEMFEQKNPKFFTQIYGSIRNIPNSFGCIDSTVSAKEHQLRKLYEASVTGKNPEIFFSYRCSKKGDVADYMNPNMTERELNSYRGTFPFGEFERYFLNLWEAAGKKVFSAENIEAVNYIGIDHRINSHNELTALIKRKNEAIDREDQFKERASDPSVAISATTKIVHDELHKRAWPMEQEFRLRTSINQPVTPSWNDLDHLSNIFDTNWAVLAGLDRGDPEANKSSARTIETIILKGLMGSRSNPFIFDPKESPRYLYILIYLADVEDHSLEGIKNHLQLIHDEFDGIDTLGSERFGAWDLKPWCEERHIVPELWQPSYARQKEYFGELTIAINQGFFKAPPLAIPGYKGDDILIEEMEYFDHILPEGPNRKSGWFGSPEKKLKNGVQDDVIFCIGGTIYAGRSLSVLDFRERKGRFDFGSFYPNQGLLGDYR